MNWDAIGSVAEALGAAGVIGSLLYLGIQVKASTRAAAVEAKLASTRMYTDFLMLLVREPELNDLMLDGRKDIESLGKDRYLRFSNLALVSFAFVSAGYLQYSKGTLNEDGWKEVRMAGEYWLKGKGVQQWWDKVGRHSFGDEFVAFVDSKIAAINGE